MDSPVTSQLETYLRPSLEGRGLSLVRIHWHEGTPKTLQIMLEHLDGSPVTIDECAEASTLISAVLDVKDPIASAYALEVSSAGMDRPLVTRSDFEKHLGKRIKLDSKLPVDGRKHFKGMLTDATDEGAVIAIDNFHAIVAWHNIANAKLMLSDDLIKELLREEKKRSKQTKHPKEEV